MGLGGPVGPLLCGPRHQRAIQPNLILLSESGVVSVGLGGPVGPLLCGTRHQRDNTAVALSIFLVRVSLSDSFDDRYSNNDKWIIQA